MTSGQSRPELSAPNISPKQTTNIVAYLADGQDTFDAMFALPRCAVSGGTGDYMELYNVDVGTPVASTGFFNNTPQTTTYIHWRTTHIGTLNTSFTGLYRCRTDTANSTQTYQLNVRCKLSINS